MIITGAPVEHLDFEEVNYWKELTEIMEWTKTNVTSVLHICWGAQAALYYHYDIGKYDLPKKCFGVFNHRLEKPTTKLVRGFNEVFQAPNSRHTAVTVDEIYQDTILSLLYFLDVAMIFLLMSK